MSIKFFLHLVIIHMLIASCGSTPKYSEKKFLKSMIFNFDPNENPAKLLTKQEVSEDVDLVLKVMERAYSGSLYLPTHEYSNLVNTLKLIKGPLTAMSLCNEIGQAMREVSDNHFYAKFKENNNSYVACLDRSKLKKEKKVNYGVGKNFYSGKKLPWNVLLENINSKKVLKISITSFPSSVSSLWEGFIEKVRSYKNLADVIILDMRGNGGGDDTKGYELSKELAGKYIRTAHDKQFSWNTPEAYQLLINAFLHYKKSYIDAGSVVPKDFDIMIEKFSNMKKDSLSMKSAEKKFEDLNEGSNNYDKALAVKAPIYILADKGCASSCESTIDTFENIQNVTIVGENTAGYIHFGNNGILVLRNSGAILNMAISYNTYSDGRFVEEVGITPDITVKNNRDAFKVAMDHYLKKL